MQQYLQNKKGLVKGVFNRVYDKYDLMNDCMSLGIHRIWKKDLGCTADKDQSRMRASELMPNASHLWRQKNQDGIAEASLIAYWGIYKSI